MNQSVSTTSQCTRCKKVKEKSEFNNSKTRKSRIRAHCKDCEREQAREFYKNNPIPYKKRASENRKQRRIYLNSEIKRIKTECGCAFCGEKTLCILDFHHHNKKEMHLSYATKSYKCFNNEIKKCVIVCANCHRKIHAGLLKVTNKMLCTVQVIPLHLK